MSADRDPDQLHEALLGFLRDPVRRRLLFVLNDKPQGVTVRQLAGRLKESPRRVRYYLEALVDAGLVSVGEERPRRGTIERTFRAVPIPPLWVDDWPAGFELADAKMFILDILRLTFDTVTEAIAAGTFTERRGWCAARAWREVDAQGWEELAEVHERAVHEVTSVLDRATERLAKSDEDAIPAVSALFLFEALPWK